MAKYNRGRGKVEKNPTAGGRPNYDEAPIANIPLKEGDSIGQSADLVAQQQGARMAREAEQGVNVSAAANPAAGVQIPQAFGPGGGSVPINSMVPNAGPGFQRSQSGLLPDDIDLLLQEVNRLVPSYETMALARRGIVNYKPSGE